MKPGPILLSALVLGAGLPSGLSLDWIASADQITSVSARTYNGYKRSFEKDGSVKPETYGFVIGGEVGSNPGAVTYTLVPPTADSSVDKIAFSRIAKIIQEPLAAQRYLPTADAHKADLLIAVFWGRTTGSVGYGQVVYGPDQDKIDAANAALLGFDSEAIFERSYGNSVLARIVREVHANVLDTIRVDRYFVVLRAFDCRSALRGHRLNLLWETRFSLSQRWHDFGDDLPRMAEVAGPYFGRDSHGLVQRAIPEGRVNVGDVKNLGDVPEK